MQTSDAKTAKPEVRAIQEAATTPAPQVVARVVDVLGDKLTSYIAGVKDARTLVRWQQKGDVPDASARRLQMSLQAMLLMQTRYSPEHVRPWFTWLSDVLDDKSPAAVLHDANSDDEIEAAGRAVIAAAKAYLAG
jgi:hypothetical protein